MKYLFLAIAFLVSAQSVFAQPYLNHRRQAFRPAPVTGGGGSTLLNGLVAYWNLDETSGSRADATGRGNTMTQSGTVSFRTGKIGNAADYPGIATTFLSCADNDDVTLDDSDWTVAFWVNHNTFYNYQGILGKENALSIYSDTNGATGGRMYYRSANFHDSLIANPLSVGTWYFFVLQWDSTSNAKKWSLNGASFTSTGSVTAPTDAAPFKIGGYPNFTGYSFSGAIDEVGVWKRLLTSSEVTELYNSGAGKTYPFTP